MTYRFRDPQLNEFHEEFLAQGKSSRVLGAWSATADTERWIGKVRTYLAQYHSAHLRTFDQVSVSPDWKPLPVLSSTEKMLAGLSGQARSERDQMSTAQQNNLLATQWHARLLGTLEGIDKFSASAVSPAGNSDASQLEREFMERAIANARKCVPEDDRIHPKVGVVVVKGGKLVGEAYRGELASGDHAEYTLLSKKLPTQALAGSTVFATLEPCCTARTPPKRPCVDWLVERNVGRVVVGTLDPDQRITGRGVLALRKSRIDVALFPVDLMSALEELNRDFIRDRSASSGDVVLAATAREEGYRQALKEENEAYLRRVRAAVEVDWWHTDPDGLMYDVAERSGMFRVGISLANYSNLPVRPIRVVIERISVTLVREGGGGYSFHIRCNPDSTPVNDPRFRRDECLEPAASVVFIP